MSALAEDFQLHPDLQALLDHHFGFACSLHAAGSLAPIAAMMSTSGEIAGTALLIEDGAAAANITDDDAVSILSQQLMASAAEGAIRASAIFCHLHNANHPSEPDADVTPLSKRRSTAAIWAPWGPMGRS